MMRVQLLTPEVILRELGQPPAPGIVTVTGGADTRIWRVTRSDGEFALRLLRANQQTAAMRERAAMDAVRDAGLPAPGVQAAGVVAGQPVLLIDWLVGETLMQAVHEAPLRAWRLGHAFGQMQARIHQIPAPPEMTRGDHAWIEWAAPDPALATLLHETASGKAALLHLDYHPLNVLVHGGMISGVLDWTNADAGDPRADVARTGAILRFLPGNPAWAPQRNTRVRHLLHHGWRAGYQASAGSLSGMAPFHAWAGALMQRDLAPRLGREDLPWLTGEWLAGVQRWTTWWRSRAGGVQ